MTGSNLKLPLLLAWRFRALGLLSLLAAFALLPAPAQAGTIAFFDPSNFQLINTSADGAAVPLDNGNSLQITGGNTGSDLPGTTDVVFIPLFTSVTFDWIYASLDGPGFDHAGFLVDGTFTELADTDGETGTTTVTLSGTQILGFRVATDDNTGEPGVFTISNVSSSSVTSTGATPEPGTLFIFIPIAAAALAKRVYARRIRQS